MVGRTGDGGIQSVRGLLTEDHDHDQEHGGELRGAPDGLACSGNTVRWRADAEFLPRTNQAAPVSPLPERHDTCGTEDGHDGGGVEHETSRVPSHERGRKDPDTKHQGRSVAVAKTAPQQTATHDEGEQEGDGAEGSEELGPVGCVGFCDRAENLGLGEVTATGEQHVPCIRNFEGLQHVKNGEEHGCDGGQGAQDQQPRLVSEAGGDEGDGNGEAEDEQERLQTGGIEDQVQLWVSVERQAHEEGRGQHDEEHDAQRGGIATSEHVQGHLQRVGQEENGRTHDEPFPTQRDDAKGNTGQSSVGQGGLSVGGYVVERTNEGERVGRGGLGNPSGTSVLDRTKPIHETDRDEQHHEGVVVSQSPRGVGDVGGHEGDEPSSKHTGAIAKVIFGHRGDGEHGQGAVNSGQGKHAPPHGVFGRVEERLEQHGANGH